MSHLVYVPLLVLVTMFSLLIYRLYEIYKVLNIDNFTNPGQCEFSANATNAINNSECILKCSNKIDNPSSHCTYSNCEELCKPCDSTSCPWNKKDKSTNKYVNYFNSLRDSDTMIPNRIKDVNIIPYNGAVKCSFMKPNTIKFPITGYVYYIYKTFKRHEGVLLGKFGDDNCLECNNIIQDLDPAENYSISVRAYNENGMGPLSVVKTFTPIDSIHIKNYHLTPPVSPIMGNIKRCNK